MAVAAARASTRRSAILAFNGAYHGGMLSFANGGSPLNAPYPTVLAEYNDVEGTLALIDQNAGALAAILIEPMIGGGGGILADHSFLEALRERATRYGIVLIFDEVMSGTMPTFAWRPQAAPTRTKRGSGKSSASVFPPLS
jgi:glutamate-1-semialdehyde 2,1-aminomutase